LDALSIEGLAATSTHAQIALALPLARAVSVPNFSSVTTSIAADRYNGRVTF
jgi:hypothetical protein